MGREFINPHEGLRTLPGMLWGLDQPSTSSALGFDSIDQESEDRTSRRRRGLGTRPRGRGRKIGSWKGGVRGENPAD